MRLLVIEDNLKMGALIKKGMTEQGFAVDVANTGGEALERIEGRRQEAQVRVLLVDDEVDYVEALAERLRTRGFKVDVATSGDQAIEKTRGTDFQAVVVDFAMPMMDGIETIKELRGLDPGIPFILLSGEATIKAGIEAARLGAIDVLEKPVDVSTIVEKLDQAQAHAQCSNGVEP